MFIAYVIIIMVLIIIYIIVDSIAWQNRVLRSINAKPKPKPKFKLKKGQKVSFGDNNPFEDNK